MSVSDIAQDFVQEYYTRLLTAKGGDLQQLYHPQAYLDHGREGKHSVQATFKSSEALKSVRKLYANSKIMVTDMKGIPYRTNQILVPVLGELLRESATESVSFSHTLVLKKCRRGEHRILIDFFRVLEPQSLGLEPCTSPAIKNTHVLEPTTTTLPTQPRANGSVSTEANGDVDSVSDQRSSSVPQNRNPRRWKEQKELKLKKKDSVSPSALLTDEDSTGESKATNEVKPEAKKAGNKPKEFSRSNRGRTNFNDKIEPERVSDTTDPKNRKPRDHSKPADQNKPTNPAIASPSPIPKEPSKDANKETASPNLGKDAREFPKDKEFSEYPKPDAPRSERNLRLHSKDHSDAKSQSPSTKQVSAGSDSANHDHNGEKKSFKFSKNAIAKAANFKPPKSYSNVTSPQIAVPNVVPPLAAMQYPPHLYGLGYPITFPSQGSMMGYLPQNMGSNQPNSRYGPIPPTQHFSSAPPFSSHPSYPDQFVPSPSVNPHQPQSAMGQPPYPQ